MNWITNIIEPPRLLLVWQPLSDAVSRSRRIVGEIIRDDSNYTFRYLPGTEDFNAACHLGFEGYPAFDISEREHTHGVLESFMLRLPPRKRSDFSKFLASFRIPAEAIVSDFALLGYSEARLPGDGFSIINPYDDAVAPCQFVSEVSGYRHHKGLEMELEVERELAFEPDRENPFDANAIKITVESVTIGYVNKCQTAAFSSWIRCGRVHATIDRKNGTTLKPRLLMFVSVT